MASERRVTMEEAASIVAKEALGLKLTREEQEAVNLHCKQTIMEIAGRLKGAGEDLDFLCSFAESVCNCAWFDWTRFMIGVAGDEEVKG